MRSPRSVTVTPIGIPWRSLKAAIDFFGFGHHRMLARNRGKLLGRHVQNLGIGNGFTQTHIHIDFHQLGRRHDVLVPELLHQGRYGFRLV